MTNSRELAVSLCKTLFDAGYIAYFAGGWVRDFIMGKESDEIDIATSAPPHIIQKLFPKTIPVGIAFGVIIVVMDGKNFEVTTFRKDHSYHDGRRPKGVDFSTPEKDALRRDFTVNGMFYDPRTGIIYDYVGGQKDLEKRIIRAIGDPKERFAEDRLRMVRAVRFSTRLHFPIETKTREAILEYAHTLFPSVSMERIWQEFNKMHPMGASLLLLHELNLLSQIFPKLKQVPLQLLEKQVESFSYFPLNCPTIIYLMELFPKEPLDEQITICNYLKTTVQDRKLVQFFFESRQLLGKKEIERAEWARFYAHPFHELFLLVEAAKILPPGRLSFIRSHEERKKELQLHIERIVHKQPVVSASFLLEYGIKPGKKMGELLKEAERISINEDLHAPENVLQSLKKSQGWKTTG